MWLADVIAAGTPLPDNGVQQENPVAWVVLPTTSENVQYIADAIRQLSASAGLLSSTPTRTYGTPLRIALSQPSTRAADALISEGALLSASEGEIPTRHRAARDELGRAQVVRNGKAPARQLVTGSGTLQVRAPRVNDRRVEANGQRQRFTSEILPSYTRRAPKVTEASGTIKQSRLFKLFKRRCRASSARFRGSNELHSQAGQKFTNTSS